MEKQREPFNSYSSYLKGKYGVRAYRVGVDAGFSCPNRGDSRDNPGCSYCDEQGSRAAYLLDEPGPSVFSPERTASDIRKSMGFLHGRYRAEVFFLYFQAYSCTYGPADQLKRIYDFCLAQGAFRQLIVSTRPDCINPEIADLLASYISEDREVWIELGLQSASDTTLKRINRGHTAEDFTKAFNLLSKKGINIVVHLIFGLPGEGLKDILDTVNFLNMLRPKGIKIHNLTIPSGSPLGSEYLLGEISPPGSLRHLEYTIRALEKLRSDILVLRLNCDVPKTVLAAPRNFWKKGIFYDTVRKEMKKRGTWQGRLFGLEC